MKRIIVLEAADKRTGANFTQVYLGTSDNYGNYYYYKVAQSNHRIVRNRCLKESVVLEKKRIIYKNFK